MERPESPIENPEDQSHYNFPELAKMEPAMISLVEKLKNEIEKGEYDTLISDDVGGRIPTLILREVMKGRSEEKDLDTFFVAGGRIEDFSWTKDLIKKVGPETRRALLVTELIESGHSIEKLSQVLENAGLKNFDIAAVFVDSDYTKSELSYESRHNIIVGEKRKIGLGIPLYAVSSKLGGVEKGSQIKRLYRYKDMRRGEKTEIQEAVNKAREDAHTMADRILSKIW